MPYPFGRVAQWSRVRQAVPLHQNISFRPNWICLGKPCTACESPNSDVAPPNWLYGCCRLVRLRMLKASARNCKVTRSPTLVFLKSEKSNSRKFGPVKVLRPRLPLKGTKPGVVLGSVQPGTVAALPNPQSVVQDAEAYQQLLDTAARADAYEALRQGLDDVAHGRTRPPAKYSTPSAAVMECQI